MTEQHNLPPKYDSAAVEKGRYQYWVEGKFFEATGDPDKQPFTVMIPPPNVTENYTGYAWDTTYKNRYKNEKNARL